LSGGTETIVERAATLADALKAQMVILHVAAPDPDFVGFDAGPDTVRAYMAEKYREEHRAVQAVADRFRERGVDATALVVQGPTVETILREAEKLQADLIALGSHGHGAMYHLLLGSVSDGVIRGATVPVLVVPTRTQGAE
jgi:nucleotide-binding universal stress UspA family protein